MFRCAIAVPKHASPLEHPINDYTNCLTKDHELSVLELW